MFNKIHVCGHNVGDPTDIGIFQLRDKNENIMQIRFLKLIYTTKEYFEGDQTNNQIQYASKSYFPHKK